jgi:hypothetical protein
MAVEISMTLAQSFVSRHSDFFFEDAHFFVEAAAASEADEFAPNKFRFQDGSVLEIQNHRARTVCHPPLSAAS